MLMASASGSLLAQTDACNMDRNAGAHALTEPTWRQLNAIYEEMGEEQYDEAFEDLSSMLARAGRDTYLKAVVNQALAQVEWARGNYAESLAYFEEAVALDILPDPAHFSLMYQIAQLYYMQERHDEALHKLDLWLCRAPQAEITSAAYVLQASIFTQKNDFTGALSAIDTAIAMDEDPKEQWYQLKLAAHFELGQFPESAETLETMISRWPDKKRYWVQLSQIYYQLEQAGRSLSVMALAYRKNLLDSNAEISYLSSLYSNSGVPYKAAEVLEKGIDDGIVPSSRQNWTTVGDSWYAAKELEKSLAAYAEAGQTADEGEIDLRRAYILVDLERWPVALDALNLALEKGGLTERKTAEAILMRGMARFNLGEFEQAVADWERAAGFEATRVAAGQWMNHLREERGRQP
jgi:tetratricopeptide (TPR) repeat protein